MMIHKKLGITGQAYAELYFERYMRWCINSSTTFYNEEEPPEDRMRREIMETKNDMQMLLANRAISLWYKKEFEKLELKFLDDLRLYEQLGTAEPDDVVQLYYNTTLDIYKLYPKPLFEEARKIRIINDTTAN